MSIADHEHEPEIMKSRITHFTKRMFSWDDRIENIPDHKIIGIPSINLILAQEDLVKIDPNYYLTG